MRITLEEYKARFPGRRAPIPPEYQGQWLAWSEDHTEILAHGGTLSEVRQQAAKRGCTRPVFQKVPRGPFIGCL